MPTSPYPPPNALTPLIQHALREKIDEILALEIEQTKRRIETRIRESVGSIASRVLERFSYERVGHDLLIRVEQVFPDRPTAQPVNQGEGGI